MTGIGPEFLKLLRGIEWDSLTARDAVDLRAALKDAVGKSDEWFRQLTKDFAETPREVEVLKPPSQPVARVENGRPPHVEARNSPREPKPVVAVKRKRGRPPKAKHQAQRPDPIAVGGANAEGSPPVQAAKLFDNSYVSKDGPRVDVPATLPADHPRLNLHRESSVTPEDDAADFQTVERAIATGRGVKDIFQVR